MVSIVLLTTEEILSKNGFWYCLDSLWVVEELEPFQDVQKEDLFAKPLSKDYYYTKYPDLARSESEDDNSLTLTGFRNKHYKWKSKICIRKLSARPKSLDQLNTSPVPSGLGYLRRSASLTIQSRPTNSLDRFRSKCDNGVRKFFNRVAQKAQPLREDEETTKNTIYNSITTLDKFSDVDLPEYSEFENVATRRKDGRIVPSSSTLKKRRKRVSFSTDSLKNYFDLAESWYDSVYGVTDWMTTKSANGCINKTTSDDDVSWSDIVSACGPNSLLRHSKESSGSVEELLSYSHHAEFKQFDVSLDEDEETCFTKFVVYKIYQTLKIDTGMSDSSPMKDLSSEQSESVDKPFNKSVYRLAALDDSVSAA